MIWYITDYNCQELKNGIKQTDLVKNDGRIR